jgi:hypothetical protein
VTKTQTAYTQTTYSSTATGTESGVGQFLLRIGTDNPTCAITNAVIAQSTLTLTASGGSEVIYIVSFSITCQAGSSATTTVTISKNNVPGGLLPTVYVDGVNATFQSYGEDTNNYYVTFATHVSTHTILIDFVPPTLMTTTYSTTYTSVSAQGSSWSTELSYFVAIPPLILLLIILLLLRRRYSQPKTT